MTPNRTKSLAVSLLCLSLLSTSLVAAAQDTEAGGSSGSSGSQTQAPAPAPSEEPSWAEQLVRMLEGDPNARPITICWPFGTGIDRSCEES
jgi:hypothetical protein